MMDLSGVRDGRAGDALGESFWCEYKIDCARGRPGAVRGRWALLTRRVLLGARSGGAAADEVVRGISGGGFIGVFGGGGGGVFGGVGGFGRVGGFAGVWWGAVFGGVFGAEFTLQGADA